MAPDPPSWVMLDRFIHRTDAAIEPDATTSEISHTCTGNPITVCIRVADPPAVSRLYLYWPDRVDVPYLDEPVVITAHRHSILFRMDIAPDNRTDKFERPTDYFVYTARSSSPPLLRLLPPCSFGGESIPELDMHYKPYRGQQQRRMFDHEIGILCRGYREFTVAQLTLRSQGPAELCVLHHPEPEKEEGMAWRLQHLSMSDPAQPPNINLLYYSWYTDAVIPFNGRFLFWVDCYLGILFADVIAETTKLHYIALPSALKPGRQYMTDWCPNPARHACVTEAGVIKLVCLCDGTGNSADLPNHSDFTITVWTLIDPSQMKWDKDFTMDSVELWAIDKRIPRLLPTFPIVSLGCSDGICFVLEDVNRIIWLVEVHMRCKVLRNIDLYIHEEEEGGRVHSTGMACRNVYNGYFFIPSQLTNFLNKHAIKSCEVSQMFQLAKQAQVMQVAKIASSKRKKSKTAAVV